MKDPFFFSFWNYDHPFSRDVQKEHYLNWDHCVAHLNLPLTILSVLLPSSYGSKKTLKSTAMGAAREHLPILSSVLNREQSSSEFRTLPRRFWAVMAKQRKRRRLEQLTQHVQIIWYKYQSSDAWNGELTSLALTLKYQQPAPSTVQVWYLILLSPEMYSNGLLKVIYLPKSPQIFWVSLFSSNLTGSEI